MEIFTYSVEFEWDSGNKDKIFKKHKLHPHESESVLLQPTFILFNDKKHSHSEQRHIAIGPSNKGKILLIIFTMRGKLVRIISARPSSRKERKLYEKIFKNS